MIKYPRTAHLVGSRLQAGDGTAGQVSVKDLLSDGCTLVFEEKLDGANSGVSFEGGKLTLQSRGHFLQGGPRERQFDLLKQWAAVHEEEIHHRIEDRYVVFGEWMYARHSVFYDALPHLFMEFDVFDKKEGAFLSTPARKALLDGSPFVSVPVLDGSGVRRDADLPKLVRHSLYKTDGWRDALRKAAEDSGQDPDKVCGEGDKEDLAEGIYVKVEKGDRTVGRAKWIRRSFVQAILDDGVHWSARPTVTNRLAPGVDLFASPSAPAAAP